ncbi:HEAT repeat domain-containing protein [Paenibacillus silviterrae]|uniref:HEAT repeat domain-containing protein n=1 Tax=Paenibacillus silviterrae TaxID=3242194 RepID=UPI0025433F56|nr:HEAT repeat domain-containing protein [Paenibacillus chinjuensis]
MTDVQEVLRYTLYATLGIVTLLILLFLYLLVVKLYTLRQDAFQKQELEEIAAEGSAMDRYLVAGDISRRAVPRTELQYDIYERYLLHRQKLTRSLTEHGYIIEYAHTYLTERLRRKLRSKKRSVRMNAMYSIVRFKMTEVAPLLLELSENKKLHQQEWFMICRVIAAFQREEALAWLTDDRRELPVFVIRQMLLVLSESALLHLAERYDSLPSRLQGHLLDVLRIRNARTESVLSLFERMLNSEDGEQRIRALKGIANFGWMSDEALEALAVRLDESSPAAWFERLMTIRLMGSLRDDRFLPYLEHWIGDSHYLVRIETAKSISRFKYGPETLQRIAEHHPDRYAREMAGERLVAME